MYFENLLSNFFKRLASTHNTAAQPFTKRERTQNRLTRNRGFTPICKTCLSSLKDADLPKEEILDSLTLLSWYIHRFWKTLLKQIFPATKLITEAYPQLASKLLESLHNIYDPNWFPQSFVKITEVPSKIIQKLSINHNKIEIKNYNAEHQPFTCTNLLENTNTSLEASPKKFGCYNPFTTKRHLY